MKIAVVRGLFLGDMLCVVPALRAVRKRWPDAAVTLYGLPWAREFAERFDAYVDEFIPLPGLPGIPEQPADPRGVVAFLSECHAREYDLLLQLHGDGTSTNEVLALCGAREFAGFYKPGVWKPGPGFIPYPTDQPEIWRHLLVLRHSGVPDDGDHLEFPLRPGDVETARGLVGPEASPFVCLHPGAKSARKWGSDRFAELADAVCDSGRRVVVTGTAADSEDVDAVVGAMRREPLLLLGKTDLGSMAAVLASAEALVSHDTGVAHLARAVGTPTVTVSVTTEQNGWPPIDRKMNRYVTRLGGDVPAGDVYGELLDLLRSYPSSGRPGDRPLRAGEAPRD